jgi:RNA polymerase sigma factor (sigma-70 family)
VGRARAGTQMEEGLDRCHGPGRVSAQVQAFVAARRRWTGRTGNPGDASVALPRRRAHDRRYWRGAPQERPLDRPETPSPERDRPDPSAPTTDALSARVSSDAAAFAELHARLAPALFGWTYLRLPPTLRGRLEPADVVQEVLCRVLTRRAEFDPARGSFRAWVFGFARVVLHEGLRALARDSRSRAELGFTDLGDVPEDVTSLTQRLARDESLRNFAARAEALAPEDRRLLLLRGLEGLEHDAIGQELGISGQAAAKRWQRLRERLGAEFEVLLSA